MADAPGSPHKILICSNQMARRLSNSDATEHTRSFGGPRSGVLKRLLSLRAHAAVALVSLGFRCCTVAALLLCPGSRAGELAEPELGQARKVYVAKCAKCHAFYPPTNYTQTVWSDWMIKMARKSRLKPAQTDLLNRYTEQLRTLGDPALVLPSRKPSRKR